MIGIDGYHADVFHVIEELKSAQESLDMALTELAASDYKSEVELAGMVQAAHEVTSSALTKLKDETIVEVKQ